MTAGQTTAVAVRHSIAGPMRVATATARAASITFGPWLDLAIRLWLAQAFLRLQVHEMMFGGPPTLSTAASTVASTAWSGVLHGVMTSSPGQVIQALCPVLLAAGLFARPAAAAMLLQATMLAGDAATLFQAALLLRIVAVGPGPLAVGHLLRRGVGSAAIPGAAALLHALDIGVRRLVPVTQAALRVWLALALGVAASAVLAADPAMRASGAMLLPTLPPMLAGLPPIPTLLAAALLSLGAATRPVALVLLLLVPFGHLVSGDARSWWAMTLGLVVLHGAGAWSVDGLFAAWCGRMDPAASDASLPHVVVVGAGFGGIAVVRGLRRARCRITLVDRRNHHLFQPLLYQVATAGLSPADIATPIRAMLRDQPNARVLLGEVTGVDPAARTVRLDHHTIGYDTLVLATGARHSYFGRDEWAADAPGLKSIEDGTAIRRRLLLAFEEAESAGSEAERDAWLTFVIVGGGPTGVELAGAIAELARHGMTEEFRSIDPATARVILVQSGPRLLPAFPPALSVAAGRSLRQLGVEVMLDSRVEAVDAAGVTVSGAVVPARTVLWAAGVMASAAAEWLGMPADKAGRVVVGADLSVPGLDRVFALGDTAASDGWGGKPVPGLAPAAKQGGAYVARVIHARFRGGAPPPPFRYRHLGSLATIGRQAAVAEFGPVRVHGALAWWLWGAAHVAFLVGGRNRLTVLLQWTWAYFTYRRGIRLITER